MIFNKITFIHIPKTAGSSIINSLNENYDLLFKGNREDFINEKIDIYKNYNDSSNLVGDFNVHLPFDLIKMNKNYLNKPVFTFVRNPYSRAVSLYFECLRDSKHHKKLNISSKTNFGDFLYKVKDNDYWFTMPMMNWIGNDNFGKVSDLNVLGNFTKKGAGGYVPIFYYNFTIRI